MKLRDTASWLCSAAVLASSTGCQSVQRCCTSFFEARGATFADTTPLPEKGTDVREVSDSSDQTGAGSEATATEEEQGNAKGGQADPSKLNRRFNIPEDLPGSEAPPLIMPPMDTTQSIEHRRSLADALFPEVRPAEVQPGPRKDSPPVTLAMMQQLAVDNSPVIRQAAAAVEQARGQAVQSGLCPNPTVGYQGDTIGTARTGGYNGVFFSQEFVTAGKLTLAQNVALNEMRAVQADLRKARIRLASDIRRNYFRVLIAQEQLKFNRAIAKLSEEVYRAQIDLVTGGESAPYEPLQLRVFAVQARNAVTQSGNSLDAAWRQLVAAAGMPHMTRQHVAGSVELPVPTVEYDTLVTMLQRHSDLLAANARITGSATNLRLQQVVPVPNVTLYAAFQHDDTTPLSDYSTNVQVSAPLPVFDRNQGNITSAHAGLVKARQDYNDVQNMLMSDLAETYNRYTTAKTISESYRTDLLPDQVRVYRGVYDRFLIDGESIDFAQVVVAQQTLAQVVTSYLQSLTDAWMSTVDLAELLQIDDLMTMDGMAMDGMASSTAASGSETISPPQENTVPDAPAVLPVEDSSEPGDSALQSDRVPAQRRLSSLSVSASEVSGSEGQAAERLSEPRVRSQRPTPRWLAE